MKVLLKPILPVVALFVVTVANAPGYANKPPGQEAITGTLENDQTWLFVNGREFTTGRSDVLGAVVLELKKEGACNITTLPSRTAISGAWTLVQGSSKDSSLLSYTLVFEDNNEFFFVTSVGAKEGVLTFDGKSFVLQRTDKNESAVQAFDPIVALAGDWKKVCLFFLVVTAACLWGFNIVARHWCAGLYDWRKVWLFLVIVAACLWAVDGYTLHKCSHIVSDALAYINKAYTASTTYVRSLDEKTKANGVKDNQFTSLAAEHKMPTPSVATVTVQGGGLPSSSQLAGERVGTFAIGKYEVTWGEWQTVRKYAVANGYDLDGIGAGSAGNHPVRDVNWYDCVKWCNAKSEMDGFKPVYQAGGAIYKTGQSNPTTVTGADGYRLPTEAEWEWAARGGMNSHNYNYSGSNDLDAVAWYSDNSAGAPVDLSSGSGTWPVGQKQANELGLYDMNGNVVEWCFDDVDGNGSNRRFRGGCWNWAANYCTVANRYWFFGSINRANDVGFRLVQGSVGEQSVGSMAAHNLPGYGNKPPDQGTLARIGGDLSQFETSYGPSKPLNVPSELALAGVEAYEFHRDRYTVVTLIGSTQGAIQISYFKKGRFTKTEAEDLMRRNWSGPVEIESLGSMPPSDAGPRTSWWIGPADDSSALDAVLTAARAHSELAIVATSRMVEQSESAVPEYAEDFFVEYLQKLDAGQTP